MDKDLNQLIDELFGQQASETYEEVEQWLRDELRSIDRALAEKRQLPEDSRDDH